MKISASRILTYTNCSLKYKFLYVDKINKFEENVHLIYGSCIHSALEHLNKQIKSQTPYEIEDVLQVFEDEWTKQLMLYGKEKDFFAPKLYRMGLNCLIKFCSELVDYDVIGTEFKFDVPIIKPDGTVIKNHSLYGLIDAIIKSKSQILVIDYKTSKDPYPRFKLDTSIQLAVYSYAVRHLIKEGKLLPENSKKTKEDYIAYYVLLKDYDTLNGEIKIQKKAMTDKHFGRMFYIIDNFLRGIENNVYVPNYDSQCEMCDYKKECLEFGG